MKGPGWFESCLVSAERLKAEAQARAGSQRLLGAPEGEALQEKVAQHSPGAGSLQRAVRWWPIFLVSFTCSPGSGSTGSQGGGRVCGDTQGLRVQRARFRSSPAAQQLPWRPGFSPLLLRGFCSSWKRLQPPLHLCIFRRARHPRASAQQFMEEFSTPSRAASSQWTKKASER